MQHNKYKVLIIKNPLLMNTEELSNRLTQIVYKALLILILLGLRLLSKFSLKNLTQARTISFLFQIQKAMRPNLSHSKFGTKRMVLYLVSNFSRISIYTLNENIANTNPIIHISQWKPISNT